FQPGFKTALVNLMPESHGTPANPAEPVPAENIRDVVVTPSGPISIKIDLKGRPLETTDQLGRRLEYVWANNGNIKAVKQPNKTIIYDYDNVGNRNKIEFKHQETSLTANFEYNSNNQIAQVTDYMDRKTSFEYSPDGTNLTRIISNTNEGLYISYKDTTFPNKITNISNAIGEEYEYSYNNNGDLEQMLDPLGNVLSIEYYDNGNIKAFKDAEDNKIEYAYDNSGFLKEEIIDQSGNRNCYSYDKSGLLRWKLDAKNSQGSCPHWDPEISSDNSESFFYDKSGRLTRTVDRLRNDKEFLYNQSGQISQIKSRDSVYTKFHYDNVGRTTRIECQDLFKNYSYDFDDNRTLLENNDSRVESFYDGFGRPLRHVTIYKWQDKLYPMEFNYQYNSNGKRTYMSNPFTPDTSYSYDDRDRLIRISQGSLIFNYSYDDSGRIDMVIYPNGVIAQREYDGKGRLTDLAYLLNGTLLWATRNIKYDRVNNVTEYTIYRNGLMENKTSYAYDSLYRLIDVAHGETDNRHHEAFSYDIANNLRISPHSTAYAYNVAHQLIEDDNYKYDYDLNGNLIRVNNRTRSEEVLFTYDCFNRLSEVFIFENGNIVSNNIYLYDGDGKKIFAKQNSNKDSNIVGRIYVYDYEDVIAELNKYGVVEATYIHGPGVDEPLAITIAGRTYYYHQDLFGSIVFITDDNGHIINYYNYESFGKLLSVECPSEYIGKPCIANHYTFLSREWDKSIGLYYFKYRWYDPYSYRFTQEDIMKTTNPYVFLDGNPTNWRDPSGLMKEGTKEYKKCYNETKTGWETGLSVAENSPLATDATKNEAKECKIELKEKKNKGNLTESVKILCSKLSQEEYNELKILTENLLKDAMKAKTGIDKFEDQYRKSLEELNNYKQELTDKYDIDLPLPEPCKKCLGIKNPEKESKGE
ncbi:MAG TPA: RHS repeat-associated core domain-containing protein, partial [bacterium]|nr:RHS repeat-associated core domain-containing protein [bacterium]